MASGVPESFDFDRLTILPNKFDDVETTKNHVIEAIKAYPVLKITFHPASFYYANPWKNAELTLVGTLPVFFWHKDSTYDRSIVIKIGMHYPQVAPFMFVCSPTPYQYKVGQRLKDIGIPNHVYSSGKVHHPYLTEWRRNRHSYSGHNIKDLIDKLFHAFRTPPEPSVKEVDVEGAAPSKEVLRHRPLPSRTVPAVPGVSTPTVPKLSVGAEGRKIPVLAPLKSNNTLPNPPPSALSQITPTPEGAFTKIRLTQNFSTAQFVDLLLQPETVDWNLERDPVTHKYMLVFLVKRLSSSSTCTKIQKISEGEMKELKEPSQSVNEASLLQGKMESSEKGHSDSELGDHVGVNKVKKSLGIVEADVQPPQSSQSPSTTSTSQISGNGGSKDYENGDKRSYQLRDRKTIAPVKKLAIPVPINKSVENAFFREKVELPPITPQRILELMMLPLGLGPSISVKDLQSRKAMALAQEESEKRRKELLLSPSDREWFTNSELKRSPYFPQVGDDLVYFREGHKAYVDKVKDEGIYITSNSFKKTLPYFQNRKMDVSIPVRVISRKFELGPPRHVSLKLGVTNWKSGELKGSHLFVKYHYIPGVKDFLVLRELHDKYVDNVWKPEDRFRSLNEDGEWIFGKVKGKASKSGRFLESKFLCYEVEWDEGVDGDRSGAAVEQLSPWEMERIPDSTGKTRRKEMSKKASAQEIRAVLYVSSPSDWPPSGEQEVECQRWSRLVEQVMLLPVADAFIDPVNVEEYPEYAWLIEYPIDLRTIKGRLDSRFYRRLESLKFDVVSIATNAEKYNSTFSKITTHARVLRDVLLQLITNPSAQDVRQLYHDIIVNSSDFYCDELRDLEMK